MGCAGELLRRTVLEILMYLHVHSGSCAPYSLHFIRLAE